MTSHIASVTWLWHNTDYDNSFLSSLNENDNIHILMYFEKIEIYW